MSNSFYYFFSATPQVLGGILALFGVFVIFKIQEITSELLALGKSIHSDAFYLMQHQVGTELSQTMKNSVIIRKINDCVEVRDIKFLREYLYQMNRNERYDYERDKFFSRSDYLDDLVKNTLIWSIFTAFIIILCLVLLSLGNIILCHKTIVIISFASIVLCVIGSFIGLIYILYRAFDSPYLKELFNENPVSPNNNKG